MSLYDIAMAGYTAPKKVFPTKTLAELRATAYIANQKRMTRKVTILCDRGITQEFSFKIDETHENDWHRKLLSLGVKHTITPV